MRGRTTGSPAFQSANYNGNEVRWHGDLQERNRHFSFLIYILIFIFILKPTLHWRRRRRGTDRLSEAIDDPVAVARIWFLTIMQRTHQSHQLFGDRHLRNSQMYPVLPAEQQSVWFSFHFFRLWQARHCCFIECMISSLSFSCMLPGHNMCASLMECPDKAPWSYSEWPVLNRQSKWKK